MSDVTDEELFASITSAEPTEPAAADPVAAAPDPVATQEPAPKARDENGRFVPTETQESATPEVVQEQPSAAKEPAIPPSRLREEAEARRQAEARAAAFEAQLRLMQQQAQPKAEPPKPADLFEDPNGWASQQLNPVQTEIRQMREEFSRNLAEIKHGPEKVAAAYQALDEAIRSGVVDGKAVMGQLEKSRDPYADIMSWHQRQSILSEVGTDPKAYRTKVFEEMLADPANHDRLRSVLGVQAPATTAPAGNTVRLPPSLNRTTSAASNGAAASGDVSDRELFESVTSRRR